MSTVNTHAGFTLIEALIYIALFTFVIGGGILSAYQIFEGQMQIQTNAREEAEVNFVLRKLDWLSSENINGINGDGDLLTTRAGSQYRIGLNDENEIFVQNTLNPSNPEIPLSSILNVSALSFSLSAGNPDILTIDLTVNGRDIGPITRYVRTH